MSYFIQSMDTALNNIQSGKNNYSASSTSPVLFVSTLST